MPIYQRKGLIWSLFVYRGRVSRRTFEYDFLRAYGAFKIRTECPAHRWGFNSRFISLALYKVA